MVVSKGKGRAQVTKKTCSIHGTEMEKYADVHLPRPRSRPTSATGTTIGMYMRNNLYIPRIRDDICDAACLKELGEIPEPASKTF